MNVFQQECPNKKYNIIPNFKAVVFLQFSSGGKVPVLQFMWPPASRSNCRLGRV